MSEQIDPARAPRDPPPAQVLSPVERRIRRGQIDEAGAGKPLSRRARQTRRTLENYLKAGFLPRYMERVRDIERETAGHRRTLARTYRRLADEHRDDPDGFARRWRKLVRSWPFDAVNELIREHNEWYPIERGLPLDPRTRDYVQVRGRSYRRSELGPEWALKLFPPLLPTPKAPRRTRAAHDSSSRGSVEARP